MGQCQSKILQNILMLLSCFSIIRARRFEMVTISMMSSFSLMYCCVLQGLTYDHVQLNFYLNGKPLPCPFTGMKGTLYPVFYGIPKY